MFVLIYKIIDFPGALNAYDCEDDDHPFDDVMTNQRYGTLHITTTKYICARRVKCVCM